MAMAVRETRGRPGNGKRVVLCLLLAIVAPSLVDGDGPYTLRSVGNCDGAGFISSAYDCNSAASSLCAGGVTDVSASEVCASAFPYGCYLYRLGSPSSQLHWNRCGDTNNTGEDRMSICREPPPPALLRSPLFSLSLYAYEDV